MKKCIGSFLILFVFTFISCQKPINPEFRGINNVVISKAGINESLVSGTAKFYNPNSFNLQLKHVDVNVFLNDKLSGHCVLDSTIDIRQLDTFYVPVSFTIDPRSIFSNALQMLVTRQVKISCDGSVKLRKSGFGFNIPVKFEQYEQLDSLLRN
ncbi:MAG: LEA type 2 family protein [Bacteroidetes bacterium]|nr:LEA type 2 family protein [Bacteroidota bacterium]MBS1933414.1 LEA type 2 family protein [Bacteroidota bacterium]